MKSGDTTDTMSGTTHAEGPGSQVSAVSQHEAPSSVAQLAPCWPQALTVKSASSSCPSASSTRAVTVKPAASLNVIVAWSPFAFTTAWSVAPPMVVADQLTLFTSKANDVT